MEVGGHLWQLRQLTHGGSWGKWELGGHGKSDYITRRLYLRGVSEFQVRALSNPGCVYGPGYACMIVLHSLAYPPSPEQVQGQILVQGMEVGENRGPMRMQCPMQAFCMGTAVVQRTAVRPMRLRTCGGWLACMGPTVAPVQTVSVGMACKQQLPRPMLGVSFLTMQRFSSMRGVRAGCAMAVIVGRLGRGGERESCKPAHRSED